MVSDASDRAHDHVIPGDVDGFYRAVEPYIAKMGRVAARLAGPGERDDVVQAALLNAWRHRIQFDPSRGLLSAWLMAITANEARRVSRRLTAIGRSNGTPAVEPSPDVIDLQQAMKRLARRQRLAVDCFYFAGLSISETAAVMGCAEGTVKSTLADARVQLRSLLR
ncbi:MAG TPA: RNA polymerase sigma factor [Candidatus Limnocylindrales bacterium]|jgi:RNA polymerase sigma-70 factor (ECF subfamily)